MKRKEERWEKEREELKDRIECLENWRREGEERVGRQSDLGKRIRKKV